MLEKTCRGCNLLLPLSAYYKHKQMKDGTLNFCKTCVKSRVGAHRENNLEEIRAYDRERGTLPHRKAQLKSLAERHMSDPLKGHAKTATGNAIRDGKLIRPDKCSSCNVACKPEAHHDDYSKPLEVRWLCRSCHCKHHRQQSTKIAKLNEDPHLTNP